MDLPTVIVRVGANTEAVDVEEAIRDWEARTTLDTDRKHRVLVLVRGQVDIMLQDHMRSTMPSEIRCSLRMPDFNVKFVLQPR